jgi:hypothetical protein
MGEERAPGHAGQRMSKCSVINPVNYEKGRELYHFIRIYIPVPRPGFVFDKVESPEKVHCVDHLCERQC